LGGVIGKRKTHTGPIESDDEPALIIAQPRGQCYAAECAFEIEFVYLAVLLDAFSRRVLGWAPGCTLEDELTLAALRMALARRPPRPGLVHHSDRGVQYAARDYTARCSSTASGSACRAGATPTTTRGPNQESWSNAYCGCTLKRKGMVSMRYLLRVPRLSVARGTTAAIVGMFLAPIFAPPAWSCSCVGTPKPACNADDRDSAVLLITAVSVTEDKHFTKHGGPKLGFLAEARIDQRFGGLPEWVGNSITVYSGYPCDWLIVEGEQYLVVVHKDSIVRGEPPFVHILSCGRTRLVSQAKTDLRLLDEASQPGRRVVGQVLRTSLGAYRLDYNQPVSGAVVTIRGHRRTVRATTDADGLYDIAGLPPGYYTATVKLPKGWTAKPLEVDLSTGGCADGTIPALPTGEVKGLVTDSNGTPIRANILIVPAIAIPSELKEWKDVWSDERGRFHLKSVPPGEYWIGVNLSHGPSHLEPFHRSFYPGVTDVSQAMRIHIGTSTVQLSAPFRLEPLPLHPIEVVVKDPSGAAVPRASVFLHISDRGYFDPPVDLVSTDSAGLARLHAPERRSYVVKARLMELKDAKYVYTCSEEVPLDLERTSPLTLVLTKPCSVSD
jgi:transposase InsO family protein